MSMTVSHRFPKLICLAAFAVYAYVVFLKYYHLSYYDWDLAFFTQAAYNLCHGSQYTSLVGINYFGDHSYYFTFLILPIFAMVPHPLTLVMLKIGAFVASAYLLYRILRRDLPQWMACVWMTLYLIFPANVFAILYEFNPEAFAPVLLLLVYDFFQREKYREFVIAAIVLCLIKENMFLVVFMFGVCGLLKKGRDRIKWGWLPMIVSAAVFCVLVAWVIPHVRHLHQHAFWVRYQHILENPLRFLSKVITGNISYVADLFGPMLVPAAFAPQSLIFPLPIFAQHLLSNEFAEHTIHYHYGLSMTPFIFLAAGAGMVKAKGFLREKTYAVFVMFMIAGSCFHALHYIPEMKQRFIINEDGQDGVRWAMIRQIPADKGVVATFEFLAPLSLRKSLYSFHKIYDESYQDPAKLKKSELFEGHVFELPDDVEYALIDVQDPFFLRALKDRPDLTNRKFEEFLTMWTMIERQGSIVLLKRRGQ